jgi:hypothetical protein
MYDYIVLFRPQRIIPTVNTSQEKVKEQVLLLREHAGADEEPIEHPLQQPLLQLQPLQQTLQQQPAQALANIQDGDDDSSEDKNHYDYSNLSVDRFLGVDAGHSRAAPSEFF